MGVAEIFLAALKLGLTSFGGPVAHVAFFRREYVEARRWLSEADFAGYLALCQALPGPTSSQLGLAIGWHRRRWAGAFAAWLGFTLPSALLMGLFAWCWLSGSLGPTPGIVRGLHLVAVAMVTQAVVAMASQLLVRRRHWVLAVVSLVAVVLVPSPWTVPVVLGGAALVGSIEKSDPPAPVSQLPPHSPFPWLLVAFFFLFVILPWTASWHPWLALADKFYRVGSLVFGGGHVVLPLLRDELVPQWVDPGAFVAGYGAAQAVPGPLFTFSTFLGAMAGGPGAAVVALVAIFLPSFLLVLGILPFWSHWSKWSRFAGTLAAVNAAVVGVLAAAWYDPVVVEAVHTPAQAVGALLLATGAVVGRPPAWVVVLAGLAVGFFL